MHTSKSVASSSKDILGIEDLACALSRGFTETKVSTRHQELITKHWIMLYHKLQLQCAWAGLVLFIIHADDSTTLAARHIHAGRSSRMTMRGLLASQGLIQYLVINLWCLVDTFVASKPEGTLNPGYLSIRKPLICLCDHRSFSMLSRMKHSKSSNEVVP